MDQYNLSIMDNQNEGNGELQDLMSFISLKYSKEEIDWYLSLYQQIVVENKVEIKVTSNSNANEK